MDTVATRVAERYHHAWTTGDFDEARSLLGDDLEVEVPINAYPSKDSFGQALESFGSQATSVDLVSCLGSDTEAMLLYDMEVPSIGDLRIVEHFSVVNGQIVRLRQVHDTAALRSSEFDHASVDRSRGVDYTSSVDIAGSPRAVYEALTTSDGIARWWTSLIDGSVHAGSSFRLGFVNLNEEIVMLVDATVTDRFVGSTCERHTGHPEWVGTHIVFAIAPAPSGSRLQIWHSGLTPELSCFDVCERGWDHFGHSIRRYVETGAGLPFDDR